MVLWRISRVCTTLHWRHTGRDSVSNHQPHDCLLNRLFRRRSKKTSKLRVTGLCAGNSPETGEFPAQKASNAANVFIWWRHHGNKLMWYYDGSVKFVPIFIKSRDTTKIQRVTMAQRVYIHSLRPCYPLHHWNEKVVDLTRFGIVKWVQPGAG